MSSPTSEGEPLTAAKRFGAVLERLAAEQNFDMRHNGTGRAKLADAVGVSVWTVGRWIKGETLPGRNQYQTLSGVLGVSTQDLLQEAGILPRDDHANGSKSAVPSQNAPVSPETACDLLGITHPTLRDMLVPSMARAQRLQNDIDRGADGEAHAARG